MTQLRLGELFCGPGGLSLGASQCRTATGQVAYIHTWANDLDENTCQTFVRNIPGAKSESVICKAVQDLRFVDLEPIDCLAFGFPCNDFSVVGERLGIEGKFGPLYSYGIAALNHFEPICFVAENVSGLSSANDGQAFQSVLQELEEAGPGYSIWPHLYHAEQYGVPQKRRRILIAGIRKDAYASFRIPTPTTMQAPPTVRDALVTNPVPANAHNNELTRQSPQVIERLKHIKPGQNAFSATLPRELMLNIKGAKISQIYKRLSLDEPSYTVTGSGGGGTHIYHWEENRALTNRERARLQGFPDDFVFVGSKESVRKQIGMAVPPPLARAVLQSLYDAVCSSNEVLEHCYVGVPAGQLSLALERINGDYRGLSGNNAT